MNAFIETSAVFTQRLKDQITTACTRIAPTWPLDEFIAVNPYWGWVSRPIPEVAAALGTLGGTRLTMPREWFRAQWACDRLQRAHLEFAVSSASGKTTEPRAGGPHTLAAQVETLIAALEDAAQPLPRLPLVTDLRDQHAPPRPGLRWAELVTHQVSQHCAAYFDRHQASWEMDTRPGLYGSWRQQLGADHSLPWSKGRGALHLRVAAMPSKPASLIATALDGMGIAEEGREDYLSAVLMSIGGWAAWCGYERWQARLCGQDDDQIEHLLAIRLAWEWLLFEDALPGTVPATWAALWNHTPAALDSLLQEQQADWLLQHSMEYAYQQPLIAGFRQAQPNRTLAAVQTVFCIDVRSEVFRRALEAVDPGLHTRGFAGFFGLFIAYQPLGGALKRPQLPGLLSPVYTASETPKESGLGEVLAARRCNALQWRQRWAEFRAAPASTFSCVESTGLLYGAKLLGDSLPSTQSPARWEDAGLGDEGARLRPCLPLATEDPAAAAAMAKGILGAMGLLDGFAPLVMIAGHGSQSANNPHAAGLDCGACGGQTGEVNARVLADLINRPTVREHLRALGVDIPPSTHFLPALHNTTTDEVVLYDTDAVPAALQANLSRLRQWLAVAGDKARSERAENLGLAALAADKSGLREAVLQRSNDWAQVRPEWGLADNAAFIVAPRARTRHLNLGGRSFLHDYDYRLDPELGVLTLIMTAPMVVTNWINMQYHASTVDNRRYGSGNKVLHNVVGGHLGVFEGNGGDLRIGLPMQSLHDGTHLRHTPLRLSVFIEAPREAIDTVLAGHEVVRHLVGNCWLHLLRIDPATGSVEQTRNGVWVPSAG